MGSGGERNFCYCFGGISRAQLFKMELISIPICSGTAGAASVSVRDLIDRWTRAQDMAMGLNRVFDILDIEPDVKNRDNAETLEALRNDISFEMWSFSYEQERPVLEKYFILNKKRRYHSDRRTNRIWKEQYDGTDVQIV